MNDIEVLVRTKCSAIARIRTTYSVKLNTQASANLIHTPTFGIFMTMLPRAIFHVAKRVITIPRSLVKTVGGPVILQLSESVNFSGILI